MRSGSCWTLSPPPARPPAAGPTKHSSRENQFLRKKKYFRTIFGTQTHGSQTPSSPSDVSLHVTLGRPLLLPPSCTPDMFQCVTPTAHFTPAPEWRLTGSLSSGQGPAVRERVSLGGVEWLQSTGEEARLPPKSCPPSPAPSRRAHVTVPSSLSTTLDQYYPRSTGVGTSARRYGSRSGNQPAFK